MQISYLCRCKHTPIDRLWTMSPIRNSIFSGTEQFFPGTQAFASPPDMASSGVWENIILYKTPTFDGVCGMIYYIIQFWIIAKHWFLFFAKLCWQLVSQHLMLCMTDINVIFYTSLDVNGRCYLPRMWWL